MAGGISLNVDSNLTPSAKPFAQFQPTSPFSPPDLRQPPATVAGGIVNAGLGAAAAQNTLEGLFNQTPQASPFQGPAGPLLSSAIGVGTTFLSNPPPPAQPASGVQPPPPAPQAPSPFPPFVNNTAPLNAPPAPATIGNITNPNPPNNPTLPPPADLTAQANQEPQNITNTFASDVAAFANVSTEAQVTTTVVSAAAVTPAPQPAHAQPAQAAPADQQAAPSSGTAPLSPQGLAATASLQDQQAQSEVTSNANQAREEQIRVDAARAALQAQIEAATAAAAERQAQLAASQAASIQIAATSAAATVNAVAGNASVPAGPAVLTVSDAAGNVLFRRPATQAEVAAAQAAADEALREANAALARLAADQAVAGQPLGLDPPKGDIRTVDPRVAAEFAATDRSVPAPIPEVPAFVQSGQVPDFVTHGDLPAFDAPILPATNDAPIPPHKVA